MLRDITFVGINLTACQRRQQKSIRSRRQRTSAGVALGLRGASAQKPIRLAFRAKKRTPPESETLAGFVDWTDQPYSDPRLQPSGLPEPAGRFHRGATRGELDSMVSGSVEEGNT